MKNVCVLLILTWPLISAQVPEYLSNINVAGHKRLWRPDPTKRRQTGIEFSEISRNSLLRIMAEFAQSVSTRLRGRKLQPRLTAHFHNNEYTRPFIYPRFFKVQ